MTGKLRLEDLRVHYRPVGGLPRQIKQRPATVADWVEVGRQLGAETVDTKRNVSLSVPEPGRYLVFRLPVESPTPKEDL